MQFTKIKFNDGQVQLETVDDRTVSDSISQQLKSEEAAWDTFHKALQSMRDWVREICELSPSYVNDTETFKVISVSIAKGEMGGIVVTALKTVAGCNLPFVIHTPHVPERVKGETGAKLPDSVVAQLKTLEREALKYWHQDRPQTKLEFSEDRPAQNHHDSEPKVKGDKSGKSKNQKALPPAPVTLESDGSAVVGDQPPAPIH